MSRRKLSVALLGSRGVPGRYGGYETLMDELAGRLVARGFEVTVYCRRHNDRRRRVSHRGARLVHLPAVRTKHLETPSHTLLAALHAAASGYDAALVVNGANVFFLPLLALGGIRTVLNVDGIEKRRAKWGAFGRAVYALSERLACVLPDVLVTDAETIREHYQRRYGAPSERIAYGVDARPLWQVGVLNRLGLASRRYFLYVSRFERENNPQRVVAAYREVGGDLPLVMVGDAPYASELIASFKRAADPRVRFPGAIYGRAYRQLLSHALAYVHATEVGGTHPALVEAMGYGNCVVVHDTPENREVAGDAALYFDAHSAGSLARALERVRGAPQEVDWRRWAAGERARQLYSWETVADAYARLFERLAGG